MNMKILVLGYSTFILQCIALKSSDAESYSAGVASASSWAGCVNRFHILLFLIPGLVLYYIPESRYHARKACHIVIDLVANGLKAALSGSFGNETCLDVAARTSYYSERFLHLPEIQSSVLAHKDYTNPTHLRRRHRVKQEFKIEEDKTRGQERRRHRHGERSRYSRDEKIRNGQHHQSQTTPKLSSEEPEVRPSPSPPLHFHSESKTEGFYCPEEGNNDAAAKYSTSFVVSGVKTVSSLLDADPNCKQGTAANIEEEEFPQIVCKQRSKPGKRSRPGNVIYPDDDGPTRDYGNFLSAEADCRKSHDDDSRIGFVTTNLNYPERECDASATNSATIVQEHREAAKESNERVLAQNEDIEHREEDKLGLTVADEPAEGNRASRAEETSSPLRRATFHEKNYKEKGREEKIVEDEDIHAPSTKSEEVLNQLGDQIAKLEKTIRTMKPEMNRKERGRKNRADYALQNIEAVLKDMKRSFTKVDERMKRRSREKVAEQTRRPCHAVAAPFLEGKGISQEGTESMTSVVDEDTLDFERSWSSVPPRKEESSAEDVLEEDSSTSQLDLTILRSETLLDDEMELAPIMTNRVKPYLVRTFDWLFTGCPGANSAARQYRVGKDGVSKTAAEWDP